MKPVATIQLIPKTKNTSEEVWQSEILYNKYDIEYDFRSIKYKYRRNIALEILNREFENSQEVDERIWLPECLIFFRLLVHFISVWTDCKNE